MQTHQRYKKNSICTWKVYRTERRERPVAFSVAEATYRRPGAEKRFPRAKLLASAAKSPQSALATVFLQTTVNGPSERFGYWETKYAPRRATGTREVWWRLDQLTRVELVGRRRSMEWFGCFKVSKKRRVQARRQALSSKCRPCRQVHLTIGGPDRLSDQGATMSPWNDKASQGRVVRF